MPKPRPLPTTDVGLVRQWRDDNERELEWLTERISIVGAKLGELKREREERKLARLEYDEMLAKLYEGKEAKQ